MVVLLLILTNNADHPKNGICVWRKACQSLAHELSKRGPHTVRPPLVHMPGTHTNRSLTFRKPPTLFSSPPWTYISHLLTPYTAAEKAGLERSKWFIEQGTGYYAEQTTQPQTLGYGLADSPAGLLAWIYEKLVNWTDKYPWEDDEG